MTDNQKRTALAVVERLGRAYNMSDVRTAYENNRDYIRRLVDEGTVPKSKKYTLHAINRNIAILMED